MARQTKDAQYETGILSPVVAAELSGHARTTIRNWTKNGTLTPISLPGSSEVRISALELMKLMIESCWPFERNLALAARNYARRSQYDHLSYTQEMVDTFGQITTKQRKEIKFVPNPPETIVWDKAGNVVSPLPPRIEQAKQSQPEGSISDGPAISTAPTI